MRNSSSMQQAAALGRGVAWAEGTGAIGHRWAHTDVILGASGAPPASSVRHPSSRKALGSQIVEGETDLGADQDDCRAGSRVRRDNRVSGGEWVAREASRQAGWQAAAAR